VKSDVKRMLKNLILETAKKAGRYISESEVNRRINEIIDRSFATNQVEMMGQQMRALGF
jgi:predicted DNA-binding protein